MERPFWSVMIPTHGCSPYLEQTLLSVRDQDPGPEKMQIAIVDDASTGDFVEETARSDLWLSTGDSPLLDSPGYCGELESLYRPESWALGPPAPSGRSGNPGLLRATRGRRSGETRSWRCVLSKLAHRSGRRTRTGISALERATAGACEDWLERIAVSNRIQCPSIVVRRQVYEELGGFRSDLSFTLDWEMWVRIAYRFPVYYEPDALAAFRVHDDSETSRLCDDGSNVVDLLRAIEIVNEHLPANQRGELRKRAHTLLRATRSSLRSTDAAHEESPSRPCPTQRGSEAGSVAPTERSRMESLRSIGLESTPR